MTITQLIKDQKITFQIDEMMSNPNMDDTEGWNGAGRHYRYIIRRGKRGMTIPFSRGPGLTDSPALEECLDCLASDAVSVRNARGFIDWCGEYGFDTDSRKAEKTYRICKRQTDKLERLLGPEIFEVLLYSCERL